MKESLLRLKEINYPPQSLISNYLSHFRCAHSSHRSQKLAMREGGGGNNEGKEKTKREIKNISDKGG